MVSRGMIGVLWLEDVLMEVPVTISVIHSGVTVVKLTLSQLITSARDVRLLQLMATVVIIKRDIRSSELT
mgnify:CR=1 FL=1